MHRYILLSPTFEGYICYGFNPLGYLIEFRNCSWSMDEVQTRSVLENIGYAFTYAMLRDWASNCGYQLFKIDTDLSFDSLYNDYGVMRDRKEALADWGKLKDGEKLITLWSHEAYKRYVHRNANWYNKMYLKTYLKKHRRDEWDKIQGKNPKEQR